MYFQESWYIILCVRLNNLKNKQMTSSIQSENIEDDFEEGEIIDDDEPTFISSTNASSASKSDHKSFRSRRSPGSNNSFKRSSDDIHSRNFVPNDPRLLSIHKKNLLNNKSNAVASSKTLRARRRRQRQRELKNKCNNVGGFRPGNFTTFKNSKQLYERNRTRENTPYEERLKEFKIRQQRIKSRSRSREKKSSKHITGSVKPLTGLVEPNPGSSLLKRLVGSGSVGIKSLEDTVITELSKINNDSSMSTEGGVNSSFQTNSSAVSIIGKDDQRNVSVENYNKVDKLESISSVSLPESNVSSHEIPLVNSAFHISEEVFNNVVDNERIIIGDSFEKKNEYRDSSHDLDEELIKLRMEALKTAVLKKHEERLKRGYLPKKISNKNDFIVDSFIEEVESLENSDITIIDDTKSECSDKLFDSNYVSDDNCDLISSITDNISGIKRLHPDNSEILKKIKLEDESQDSNSVIDNLTSDIHDEEHQLRALALQSFVLKKAVKDSDTDSDKVSLKMELTEEINDEDGKENIEHCEKSHVSEDEDLDEDILRAQLLKTLSANLPTRKISESSIDDDLNSSDQSASKTFVTSNADLQLDMQSRKWSEKMVPKLVISLGSDSESEAESPSVNFVKSIDLLIQRAKEKSEQPTIENDAKPKLKKKITSTKQSVKKPLLKKGSPSTPMAVKHLPIQKQEEYLRLKLKLAEKMKSNQLSKTIDPIPSSSNQSQNPPNQRIQKDLSVKETVNAPGIKKNVNSTSVMKKNQLSSKGSNVSIKKNVPLKVTKTSNVLEKTNVSSFKLKPSVLLKNNTKVVNKISPVPQQSNNLKFSKELKNNQINLQTIDPKSVISNKKIARLEVTKNLKVDPVSSSNKVLEKINNDFKLSSGLKTPAAPSSNAVGTMSSTTVARLVNKSVVTKQTKDNQSFSQQPIKFSGESNMLISNKDNEGNSDKENEVIKNKKKEDLKNNVSLEDYRLSNENKAVELSMINKLKEAQDRYEDTLSLVLRLEKELEDAKKILKSREKIVKDFQEKVDKFNKPTVIVKLPGNNSPCENTATDNIKQILPCSSKTECWDPDGVLCPYQLAGSCKDPLCSYHHIPTS